MYTTFLNRNDSLKADPIELITADTLLRLDGSNIIYAKGKQNRYLALINKPYTAHTCANSAALCESQSFTQVENIEKVTASRTVYRNAPFHASLWIVTV